MDSNISDDDKTALSLPRQAANEQRRSACMASRWQKLWRSRCRQLLRDPIESRPTEVKLHRSRQLKTSLANHVGFMLSALCVLLSKGDGAEVTANSSVLSRLSCSSALSDPLSETCFHEFGHTKVLLSQCNGDLCSNPVCTDVLKAIRTLQTFKPAQF
ncbi:unnamed protein product [Durusdinium trenchii]|uniref:Uncharacterized protein n=1 Tax=Durusdinium trenchii TaxID=1381693 RepID=A0ABP0I1R3_9DINO